MADFADRIKMMRTMNEMSLEEMAKKLGTTRQSLSRYELRQRFPKSNLITKYAKALDVDPAWLIGYDDKHPTENKHNSDREQIKKEIDSMCDKQIETLKQMIAIIKASKEAV